MKAHHLAEYQVMDPPYRSHQQADLQALGPPYRSHQQADLEALGHHSHQHANFEICPSHSEVWASHHPQLPHQHCSNAHSRSETTFIGMHSHLPSES